MVLSWGIAVGGVGRNRMGMAARGVGCEAVVGDCV